MLIAAVLVQAGGNDVIRLTSATALRDDIAHVAAQASTRARLVILMPAGNVGNAPFSFPPWSWAMTSRARDLHAAIRAVAETTGAVYVNLYKDKADDQFVREPKRLHAADGLHPSDDGYALWTQELLAQSPLRDTLR